MRLTELILFLLISKVCFGQDKYVGFYYDRFHETIELKADSTFIHNYRFDLSSSWTTGKWNSKNDTIYLITTLVKDTVRLMNSSHKTVNDSLVLSADQKVERIQPMGYNLSQISSGGQNRFKPPNKLYWKKEKLYRIKRNGNLDFSKAKQFWTRKKYKTYFIKKIE